MDWIVISLIAVVALFVILGVDKKKGWTLSRRQILCLAGLLLVIPSMFATVPTGHTGIMTLFGEVQDGTLEAGLHFKNPLMQVVVMDNRTQKAVVQTACFSSDTQEVSITYTINYQIEKQNAMNIYKQIGPNYYDTVMQPRIMDVVKSVFAQYSAGNLISSRAELSTSINEKLKSELASYNIIVVNTAIEDMDFSDAYTNAVEEKQVAEQKKLQAEIEQEQMLLEAKAQAEKQQIAAQAEAEVAKIQADAAKYAGEKEAEMNKKLGETLTKELIEYYYSQKWDGKLPTFVGGETVLPILGESVLGGAK